MCRRIVAAPHLDKSVLPKLDAVLISHNHYDHLDSGTVGALHRQYGDTVTWCAASLEGDAFYVAALLITPVARDGIQPMG